MTATSIPGEMLSAAVMGDTVALEQFLDWMEEQGAINGVDDRPIWKQWIETAAKESSLPIVLSGTSPCMVALDEFTEAYVKCALWTHPGEGEPSLDAKFDWDYIHRDTLAVMIADCQDFQEAFGDMIAEKGPGQAGHDFWLTRNRHGAGFWDGDWPINGKRLTEMSHPYGGFTLYLGDDGKIHGL